MFRKRYLNSRHLVAMAHGPLVKDTEPTFGRALENDESFGFYVVNNREPEVFLMKVVK